MRLPKLIKVGHLRVSVVYQKGFSASAGVNGAYGADTQTVIIDPSLGPDQERETLIHEALHAIMAACGLDLLFKEAEKALDTKEFEEQVVNNMSSRLLELLRDNPNLLRFLLVP